MVQKIIWPVSIEYNELFNKHQVVNHIMIAEPRMYGRSIRESDDERDNAITTRVAVNEEAAEDESVDGEKDGEESLSPRSTVKPLPKNFVPRVYRSKDKWGVSPIVVKEYKLIFFHQGKVRRCKQSSEWITVDMHLFLQRILLVFVIHLYAFGIDR